MGQDIHLLGIRSRAHVVSVIEGYRLAVTSVLMDSCSVGIFMATHALVAYYRVVQSDKIEFSASAVVIV